MNNELIEKYFQGLCTAEERESVTKFLNDHPDHPFLLKEWEEADNSTPLPGNYTQQMFDAVNTVVTKPVNSHSRLLKLALAACLAGIIMSLFYLNKKNDMSPLVVKVEQAPDTIWTAQRNDGQKDLALVLADGSKMTLSPHAYIRYRANFNGYDKREIYMTGHIFFDVAKNKRKPFIVYSRDISTTALGTAFYVNAPEKDSRMNVKLFEGKVVVAITGTVYHHAAGKNYYLLPGQELEFNSASGLASIHEFKEKNKPVEREQKKEMPPGAAASYMFNNQTLADVLDQLSAMYQVNIQYSKTTVGNIYFIGKIDREDSLEKIINDIAVLNKLSVKKQHGTFILRKK